MKFSPQRGGTQICTHILTRIKAKAEMRLQSHSKTMALKILAIKVKEHYERQIHDKQAKDRKEMIDDATRSTSIRTYRYKENLVLDNRTSQKMAIR